MDSLLPSEIARLVLGYLEDQKCSEAARLFLESSPHLEECRAVISKGKKFSTKVGGLNLLDLFEKFAAVSTTIQERFNKIATQDQGKEINDVLEQLKVLIETTREQRFLVNINVPTQSNSQLSGGSPILSSSMLKKHHSSTERERSKRSLKSVLSSTNNSESNFIQALNSPNLGATPLESLPGHVENSISQQVANTSFLINSKLENSFLSNNNNTSNNKCKDLPSITGNEGNNLNNEKRGENDNDLTNNLQSNINEHIKCTTATSTEELYSVCTAEVQTALDDLAESEAEPNDEPIENLSLLTKELLNRTELQERIAENINKAILPTDSSLKEESLNESLGGELNTSVMTELNNAIKSIVEATESDPVFEKFLNEVIGPQIDTDTSPDEDETKSCSKLDGIQDNSTVVLNQMDLDPSCTFDNKSSNDDNSADIPLKQRLRSSSRQQNNRGEDETDKQKDKEREQNVLEDQNAAAIQSIINANITIEPDHEKCQVEELKEEANFQTITNQSLQLMPNKEQNKCIQANPISVDSSKTSTALALQTPYLETKMKKPVVKRPRATKLTKPILDEDAITVPTLIVCSKSEYHNYLSVNPSYQNTNVQSIASTSMSHFIPIAPKGSNKLVQDPLYFRTVNVPKKCLTKKNETKKQGMDKSVKRDIISKKNKKCLSHNKKNDGILNTEKHEASGVGTVLNTVNLLDTNKLSNNESITLYNSENSLKTLLDNTNMPTISIDENINISGASLSPYLKFNCNKTSQPQSLSDIELEPCMENRKPITDSTVNLASEENKISFKSSASDIISKRTPKSLMKSRSKNHRLSLSTPRRRNSHVRVLDFNTPAKISNSAQKVTNDKSTAYSSKLPRKTKSGFRASLFKSPPFTGSATSVQTPETSMTIHSAYNIQIATRSPAPKLMGGWDQCNGVGIIIGEPIENTDVFEMASDKPPPKKKTAAKTSWDADLRKNLCPIPEQCEATGKSIKNLNSSSKNEKQRVTSKIEKSLSETKEVSLVETNLLKENNLMPRVMPMKQEILNSATDFDISLEKNTPDFCQKRCYDACINLKNNEARVKCTVKSQKVLDSSKNENSIKISDLTKQSNNKDIKNKTIKKYAQLKTIKTNLKKTDCRTEFNPPHIELSKMSNEITHPILQFPDMTSLETPTKDILTGIPPTPRVLSPSSSNIVTPFIKINDDSTKIRSFISTPEFPKTPCITLTPKQTDDNRTNDDTKNACSYYRPSIGQTKVDKCVNILPSEKDLSVVEKLPFQTNKDSIRAFSTDNSTKLEITQFEVIKENLPKSEAVKELKISLTSKDVLRLAKPEIDRTDRLTALNNSESKFSTPSEKNFSNSDNESNDSNSSSSSGSSSWSSSSSSSSTSCAADNTSIQLSSMKKRRENNLFTEINKDSEIKASSRERHIFKNDVLPGLDSNSIQKKFEKAEETRLEEATEVKKEVPKAEEKETSPLKVFSLTKTESQIESTSHETPAKDEALLEADISETPNSSKTGIESVTNLSFKISAFEQEKTLKAKTAMERVKLEKIKQKPKIVDVKRIDVSTVKHLTKVDSKLTENSETKSDELTSENNQLGLDLEEKRQRTIAKIKEAPKSNIVCKPRGRPRLSRTNFGTKSQSLKKGRKPQTKKLIAVDQQINTEDETSNPVESASNKTCNKETFNAKKNSDLPTERNSLSTVGVGQDNVIYELNLPQIQPASSNPEPNIELTIPLENEPDINFNSDAITNKIDCLIKIPQDIANPVKTLANRENADFAAYNQVELNPSEDKTNIAGEKPGECKTKLIMKPEVDQVKRNLFSGSESSNENKTSITDIDQLDNPKQELSSVLQCLQLVPAYKNDEKGEENNSEQPKSNIVEYHFICDESKLPKRRRRKNSNQEQDYEIKFEIREGQDIVLKLTPYEEIFNLSPTPTKKVVTKKSLFRKETQQTTSDKLFHSTNNESKPLATSTPFIKSPNPKIKRAAKILEKRSSTRVENTKKSNKNSEPTQEDTGIVKTRKRKNSESEKSKQNAKRQQTAYPQALINSINVEELLTLVHGPE
ncbi:serine-rich adhesin for platelets-like isoform X2 [Prorops nasuta]|uniref:serine-rich adhesin for platelets-like isoform X2 n=1 Tax=Prorops nasuta TaxID=863751 RepID=UPI0034CE588D